MLIVIEGIDGSGKSTVAPLVYRALNSADETLPAVGKHEIGSSDPESAQRAEGLRRLIWSSTETSGDTFGAAHWILLIASWYTALAKLRADLAPGAHGVAVMDGWFYRNIAKTLIREPLDPVWVESLFSHAPVPDLVVLLDVDPATAWTRRADFKETELGRWDGFTGPPRDSFCGYQEQVRRQLLRMARQRNWLVIKPGEDSTPASTAARIISQVECVRSGTNHPQEEPCSLTSTKR